MGNDPQGNVSSSCIIYFHEGFSPYLPFAIRQARISNPDARIILLGDSQNRIQGIQYEHHLLSDYEGRHQEFLDCYQHFHAGHLGDERRCIERWIYLSEFTHRNDIHEFLFLDSDALLFSDMRSLIEKWRGHDAAGTPYFYGFCYFERKGLVTDYAEWIFQQYKSPTIMKRWIDLVENGKAHGTKVNITDMTLAQMFITEKRIKMFNAGAPLNGKMIDMGLLGGAFHHGRKDKDRLFQEKAGGKVWALLEGNPCEVVVVHIAGFYKNHISGLCGWSWPVVKSFFRPNYRRNLKQLFWYGLNGFRFRRYLEKNYEELRFGMKER
jgi:hypothetical protein